MRSTRQGVGRRGAATLVAVFAGVLLSGCNLFANPDARVAKAEQLMAQREYRAAIIELKNAIEAEPDHTRARLKLAEASLYVGDAASADKELRRAFETGAKPADVAELTARVRLASGELRELLAQIDAGELPLEEPLRSEIRGRALLGLGELQAAMEAFNTALQSDPERIEAQVGLAQVQAAQGDTDAALAQLDALTQRAPQAANAWLVRGTLLAQRGQFEPARQSFERALEHAGTALEPTQQGVLLAALTETRLALGDLDAARAAHAQLVQLAPNWPVTRVLKARLAMAGGDFKAASAELQPIVTSSPDFVPARFLLASALIAEGNLNQAEQHLARVLQLAPDNLEARKLLAQVRLQLNRTEDAMQVLMPAVQADASDSQLSVLLGLASMQRGDAAAATDWLNKALAADPGNDAAQLSLVELALRRGDQADALRRLEALRERDPKAVAARLLLARLRAQANDTAQTEALIREVLDAAPERAAVRNAVGLLYLDSRRYDEALAQFRKATELDAKDARYWMNAARAQLALGHQGPGRESLQRALAENPDWTPAVSALVLLDLREGEPDAALARVAALRKRRPEDPAVMLMEGDLYATLQQYPRADTAYGAAQAIQPTAALAIRRYRVRQLGKLAGATAPLEEWLGRSANDQLVRTVLAGAYESSGQRGRAIEQYERVVRDRDDNAAALNNLAWLYHEAGDARALPTARRAYERAPGSAAVADTYGWILVQQGKVAEGLAVLQDAVGKNAAGAAGVDPEIEYHLAVALSRAGSGAQARERLTRLLDRAPEFASRNEAQKLLQQLQDGANET